jgi:hypothetical protein
MNVQSVFCSFVVLVLLQRATAGPHAYVHPKERFAASTVRMGLVAGVQVSVSTRDMRSNNEPIVVTVAGVPGPDIGDLVAMYAPAAASPDTVVPVNWAHVATGNPDYTTTGFAQVSFKLINFRQDMRFRLLRNSTFSPVVIGESPVVANHIKDQPSQVHLALHADGSSMVVQWNSGSQAPQTVQYGTTPPSSSAMAWPTSQPGSSNGAAAGPATSESSVLTYTADMMCGPPANGIGFLHPGHMHQALIPLAAFPPNTRVYYRVGSPGAGWSDTFSFVTPPPPGGMGTAGGGAAFKFLMFADVGQADPILFTNSICPPYCPKGAYNWSPDYAINSTLLVPKIVAEEDVQLGLLLGDVAYANGYAPDWDVFGHQFQPAFTKWPLMAIPGNHERNAYGTGDAMQNQSNDSGGDCNVPFTYRMYTPAATLWARPAQQTPASISSSSSSRDGKQPAGGVAATGDRIPVAASRRLSATPQHHQQQQEEEGLPHASTKAKPHVPPRPGPLDPWRSYYAFTMGPVAFVLLDTETFSHHGSEQRQYVAQELAKVCGGGQGRCCVLLSLGFLLRLQSLGVNIRSGSLSVGWWPCCAVGYSEAGHNAGRPGRVACVGWQLASVTIPDTCMHLSNPSNSCSDPSPPPAVSLPSHPSSTPCRWTALCTPGWW